MSENVTGERKISTRETPLPKFEFPLLPTGDYELKIKGPAKVKAPSERKENSVPYVSVMLEALNTEELGRGKNVKFYQNFFLKTQPSDKGFVSWKSSQGINGLAKALGEDFEGTAIDYATRGGENIEILNPDDVVAYLNTKDGMVIKARVKQNAGNKAEGFSDSNSVNYFIQES